MKKYAYGFTIIELATVIFVIGVLATVSAVTYRGVQKRAQVAAYIAAVDGTEKALRVAAAKGLLSPTMESGCVGSLDDYPAQGIFLAGECQVATLDSGERFGMSITSPTYGQLAARLQAAVPGFSVGRLAAYSEEGVTAQRGILVMVIPNSSPDDTARHTAYILWVNPNISTCGKTTGILEEILASADDVLAGRKTIEEAYGSSSGITLEYLQELVDGAGNSPDSCVLEVRL